jgi:hypothetical protein
MSNDECRSRLSQLLIFPCLPWFKALIVGRGPTTLTRLERLLPRHVLSSEQRICLMSKGPASMTGTEHAIEDGAVPAV